MYYPSCVDGHKSSVSSYVPVRNWLSRYSVCPLQILVLLDTTPDQSMLDEGIAREIINRVQKLRKKASLVPTDAITAYYGVTPADGELARVAASHQSFIEGTLKAPFRPAVSRIGAGPAIIEETTDVSAGGRGRNGESVCVMQDYCASLW